MSEIQLAWPLTLFAPPPRVSQWRSEAAGVPRSGSAAEPRASDPGRTHSGSGPRAQGQVRNASADRMMSSVCHHCRYSWRNKTPRSKCDHVTVDYLLVKLPLISMWSVTSVVLLQGQLQSALKWREKSHVTVGEFLYSLTCHVTLCRYVTRCCFSLLCRIWQHLVEIVKTGKVSVIITTHYIEEARQANVVRGSTHAWTHRERQRTQTHNNEGRLTHFIKKVLQCMHACVVLLFAQKSTAINIIQQK